MISVEISESIHFWITIKYPPPSDFIQKIINSRLKGRVGYNSLIVKILNLEWGSKWVKFLDKLPEFEGKLTGIKGQYLIFDSGVINLRRFSGYEIKLSH